ncbi:MAG TPA: PEP-CTERM sorting domain-containing protein, partial [Bryobacteraceae bacterium]
NTTSWDIDLYANSSAAPGTLLSQTNLTAAQVTSQVLGTGIFGGATFTFYEFTASIPGLNVGPGTYWLSPLSHNPDQTIKFIWKDGTGGTGTTYQELFTNGTVSAHFPNLGDRAFTIDGTITPEPSGYLLMGSGLVLGALIRRKRA